MRIGILWVCASLLCLCAATPAFADAGGPDKAARDRAAKHFNRGVKLYQEGAYRAALVEFERAMQEAPDYRLHFNIAQTQMEIGDYLSATRAFEAYLREGGADIAAERRAAVARDLKEIRERIGQLAITSNGRGLAVFVDDQRVGRTPLAGTVRVNVGQHRVEVRHPSGRSESAVVAVAGGDVVEVHLELTPLDVPRSERGVGWSRKKKLAASGLALAALTAGGAVFTGVLAKRRADEHDELVQQIPANRALAESRARSAKSLAIATDALAGLGIASAAVGVVLWVLDRRGADLPRERPARARRPEVVLGASCVELRWPL